MFAATVIYLIGTFGVTVFGSVPLNNVLDRFNSELASDEETALQRANFEGWWNILNIICAISSTFAAILIVFACLK